MSLSKHDIIKRVNLLVGNAELGEAIKLLIEFSKDNYPALFRKITMLSFRLKDNEKEFNMGFNPDPVVKNQIAKAILDSIKEMNVVDSQIINNPDLRQYEGLRLGNMTLYDRKVIDQYQILQKSYEANHLSSTIFIQALSKLFERGTFRLEPCIRSCDTQYWHRRWISAFDTKRLIELMLPKIQSRLDNDQQVLLFEIKQALFKYCDTMGAYLFETKVDDTFLDQYYSNNNFPKEKKINFSNNESYPGENISDLVVKKINRPLRRAVSQFNQLSATIPDSYNYPELPECEDCICK